jgi:hypothetical protein
MPMFEMTAGMFNFFWSGATLIGLWLLYRIFQLVKAIHFMVHERFTQVSTDPLDQDDDD